MSDGETWAKGHQQHNAERATRISTAIKCLKLIRPLIEFESVVDFGSGIGAWLYAARNLGAKTILGIEGDWIANTDTVIEKEHILIQDLAAGQPKFAKEFDLAMTIEVAEHLPEKAANGFCASLASASDYILFSAAIPGQGGLGHVNEQPLPYWVARFWNLGYVPIEPIRPYIAKRPDIYPWLRTNLIMFVKYDMLIRSDRLLKFARPISDFELSYPSRV